MPKIVTKARQLRLQKQINEGRDITLQLAAEEAGIDRAALTRIELGKTKGIEFDTLTKLCLYYGVQVGSILEFDPNQRKASHGGVSLATP